MENPNNRQLHVLLQNFNGYVKSCRVIWIDLLVNKSNTNSCKRVFNGIPIDSSIDQREATNNVYKQCVLRANKNFVRKLKMDGIRPW